MSDRTSGILVVVAFVGGFGFWIYRTATGPLGPSTEAPAQTSSFVDRGPARVKTRYPAFDSEESYAAFAKTARSGDTNAGALVMSLHGTHLEANERVEVTGFGDHGLRRVETSHGAWWVAHDALEPTK